MAQGPVATEKENPMSLSKRELEAMAMQEYQELVHTVVPVKSISGYYENDSYDFNCPGGETTVKICSTGTNEILRWMDDGWLDPVYEVEIVQEGRPVEAFGRVPLGTVPRSCWIHGTSRHLDGREEPGDILFPGLSES